MFINGAIVCLKPGTKLTKEEREVLYEYIAFLRDKYGGKSKAKKIKGKRVK